MSNIIIGRIVSGSITCSYHIQCAGCNECRELDMTKEMLPIIEDSLRARAVRQGFHLMPFSPEEDRWFCTACAETRGADAKLFTARREQVKAAAYLKSKAADEKHRSDYEKRMRKDGDTIRKQRSIAGKVLAKVWTPEEEAEYVDGLKKSAEAEGMVKKAGHVQPKATKKKPSRKKKP